MDRYEPENAFSDLYNGTTTNPNGAWNIRICDQKSQNIGSLQYVELVFEPEGCAPPTDVTSTDITASSVQLDWADNNACMGSVVVEYGPVGFTPGNGLSPGAPNSQVAVLNCTDTYLLTGLQAVTDYDIYICLLYTSDAADE